MRGGSCCLGTAALHRHSPMRPATHHAHAHQHRDIWLIITSSFQVERDLWRIREFPLPETNDTQSKFQSRAQLPRRVTSPGKSEGCWDVTERRVS
ncbi:hypothetical protein E2C01_073344 [Portunus trituberculatus]|uniref:Uncharacterized protein n=1 Tax=Portunus trituberculatus TaxID=210409 RepID=A0A5B7IAB8_PORTR|nr:hypothetical protein [Portunus trituberculatus]